MEIISSVSRLRSRVIPADQSRCLDQCRREQVIRWYSCKVASLLLGANQEVSTGPVLLLGESGRAEILRRFDLPHFDFAEMFRADAEVDSFSSRSRTGGTGLIGKDFHQRFARVCSVPAGCMQGRQSSSLKMKSGFNKQAAGSLQ